MSASEWQLVDLVGPDAQDFLNRLTTVDTRNLPAGEGRPGFFLNPQGKVEAYFHLWRPTTERFLFEVDPGQEGTWKTRLLEIIDRYTFAEKMELKADLGLNSFWLILETEEEKAQLERMGLGDLKANQCLETGDGLLVFHHGSREFGRTWLSLWGSDRQISDWAKRHSMTIEPKTDPVTLRSWRVEQARPTLDRELTTASIPLELGMMEAIAENKGCYPGQEVIERIISIGSPAKRLVKLARADKSDATPIPEKAKLVSESETPVQIGEITSVAGDLALALVKKLHAREGTRAKVEASGAILEVVQVK